MSKKSLEIIVELKQELARSREKAEYWEIMAMTDDLTGLHNRRLLGEIGEALLEKRRASHNSQMTLLFIDLDDFGKLNKKYGDDVGDEALKALADGVRRSIRKTDIAIRKGGDEFVIILVGANEQDVNDVVKARIQNMLNGELFIQARQDKICIRGSVGAFPYNPEESPFENIKLADVLMREEKQARKKAASSLSERPSRA